MNKRTSVLAAAAAALATQAGPAIAQDWDSVYVGVHAGYTDGDADSPYGNVNGPYVFHNQTAPDVSGTVYGAQVGFNHQIGDHWVVGIEGQGTFGDRSGDDNGTGGDVNGVSINSEYSLRGRAGYLVTPSTLIYGTGGYTMMRVTATAPLQDAHESIRGWTYGIGAEQHLGQHWSVFGEVRHDEMNQHRFSFPLDGYDEGITVDTNTLRVGVNYHFGTSPPPPPPPPPVVYSPPPPPPPVVAPACPTSDFVVYFEWDHSNLNQAALETIDAAANRARSCNISGVLVVGHTDTSGSAQYNVGLSERRASVVRDALVARGISADSIQTQARGETDLARATRDGVREPLNRRTAVTISFR